MSNAPTLSPQTGLAPLAVIRTRSLTVPITNFLRHCESSIPSQTWVLTAAHSSYERKPGHSGGRALFPEGPDCNLELHLDGGGPPPSNSPSGSSVTVRAAGRKGQGSSLWLTYPSLWSCAPSAAMDTLTQGVGGHHRGLHSESFLFHDSCKEGLSQDK